VNAEAFSRLSARGAGEGLTALEGGENKSASLYYTAGNILMIAAGVWV
jgi:hypothetical protein